MHFNESERGLIGVEWELQMIDKDTGDLRQSADAVMDIVESMGDVPNIHREMLLNTIEITSNPRRLASECLDDLLENIALIQPVTTPMRIDLAAAGTHPFATPAYQRVTDTGRYNELVERTQYWGRQMQLYGVHVHIGIEDAAKVLPILNALLTRFAHLQALSSSSPYWAGEDTGYASNRAMYFQQLPTAGIPRQFEKWDDLERYVEDVTRTGIISDFSEIRWDIRPSPKLGTIEIRVFDAATNIREVGVLVALTATLVEYYSRMHDRGEELPRIPDWYIAENKWRASRYGMEANLIVDEAGNQEDVTTTIRNMLPELLPIAEEIGCRDELEHIHEIIRKGAAYQRLTIAAARHEDGPRAMVELMQDEFKAGHPIDPLVFLASKPNELKKEARRQ
ncbi:glutamate--cysteine ligase [Gleimia europaea]|uniref:Putative glutamate--cysteine ligase 2 n=1 Tax=Gleimia europaea ACS-120-V-Col10b TaxID=883069 RepID=A0A9W5REN5_9ACTO|nr:glutamate--cysteine ligase [Gleimia europaea]EPD30977.1 YbdK family carboxylate-amine ligase [Gleimia europaea ACS-120-V-Col10b]